jgi:Domain of unknown function (DUF1707)/2TM domain
MRIGDREREATIDELRRHGGAGRLDVAELEERIGAAFGARTLDDLAALTGDLPGVPESDFGAHLRVFLAVQALLLIIWAVTGAGYFWPIWPFLGWGIGVAVHGLCEPGREPEWDSASKKARRRRAIASS